MDSRHKAHYRSKGKQGAVPTGDNTKWTKRDAEVTQVGYERHANTTKLHPWPRRTLDPIQRLPSEVVTFIIDEELRSNAVYPARLIELTTVSQNWQGFLFSTPTLWSELYIDEQQPDLLATLSVFVHLSGMVALKCVIWGDLIQDWPGIMSVILPVYQRITTVTVRTPKRWGFIPGAMNHSSLDAVSALLEHLGERPNVKVVIFDDALQFSGVELERLNVYSNIHFIGKFFVGLTQIRSILWNHTFFNVIEYNRFRGTPVVLPESVSLSLVTRLAHENDKSMVVNAGVTLPDLNYIAQCLNRFREVEHLIRATASNLRALSLQLPVSQVAGLVDCLQLLPSLQKLDLEVLIWPLMYKPDIALSGIIPVGLRTLNVTLAGGRGRIRPVSQEALGELSTAFKRVFPGVKSFSLSTDAMLDAWHIFASSYIETLEGLESLSLRLRGANSDPIYLITLWSLRDLRLEDIHTYRFIETPNLLRLELTSMHGSENLDKVNTQRLRKLIVRYTEGDLDFNQLDVPELRELNLNFYGQYAPIMDTQLFPQLVSIILASSLFTNPQGTSLCLALLYHPDHFPCLQELHFNICVEWDILFLMLELRNLGTKDVTRIRTVDLPFVPFVLHQPLALLLEGTMAKRPSLTDLSLESTRELLFDDKVQGCFFCLKNLVPACASRMSNSYSAYWEVDSLYPALKHPPNTVPAEVGDWMVQRSSLVREWKASYKDFIRHSTREDRCRRFMKFDATMF